MGQGRLLKTIHAQISETPEQFDSQTDVRRATTVNMRLAKSLADDFKNPKDIYALWECTQTLTQTLVHIGEQLKCDHPGGGVVIDKCKYDLENALKSLRKAQVEYTQRSLDQIKGFDAYKVYLKTIKAFKGNDLRTLAFYDPKASQYPVNIYLIGSYLKTELNASLKTLPRACFGFHGLNEKTTVYSASTLLKFPPETVLPKLSYKV